MIAIDTNVLVKYVVDDDAGQNKIATDVIEQLSSKNPGFICREVLIEFVGVLASRYSLSREQISGAIYDFLSKSEIVIEEEESVEVAIDLYRNGKCTFSSTMIIEAAYRAKMGEVVTFDDTVKNLPNVRLLK